MNIPWHTSEVSAERPVGRVPALLSVGLMAVGVIGFVVALILNVFLLDNYNAYGEVPIPGTGTVHLPAGEVTVNLHTRVIASPNGGGLPVPPLSLHVTPPTGVAEPEFEESIGMTTTVNNDTRRRLWRMRVATAGDYQITTDGQVSAYIGPQLAFGRPAGHWSLLWVFAAVFVLGLVSLIAGILWAAYRRRRPVRTDRTDAQFITDDARYVPDGQGVRLQQLKTITALRDCGALTPKEFAAEKRRILRER